MPLYFLVLDRSDFEGRIRPALAASRRQRSFVPCRALCAELLPAATAFAQRFHLGREEAMLAQVARGLAFDLDFWRALAGEMLWYSAREIPEFQTAEDTLCCLLAPDQLGKGDGPRKQLPPILQAHHGSRDLVFGGGYYRPEQAGYNGPEDVARLADYLASVEPATWKPADLVPLVDLVNDEDRAEELEYARDWFPALREFYQKAHAGDQVVVCEMLSPAAG
jgi:hypothetical protein